VEIGVWPGRQNFERKWRGLREVAHGDPYGARLDPPKQTLKAFNVHRLPKAVADGLLHQRMRRNLTLTCKILRACHLVWEHCPDQVIGGHTCQLRRLFLGSPHPQGSRANRSPEEWPLLARLPPLPREQGHWAAPSQRSCGGSLGPQTQRPWQLGGGDDPGL